MAISALAFTAQAGTAGALGTATVTNPEGGMYTQWYPHYLEMSWLNEAGSPQDVSFVSNTPSVVVIMNSSESAVVPKLVNNDNSGIGGLSTRAATSTSVSVDLTDLYEAAGYPQTGTLTVMLPAGLVQNSNGDTNEAQTILYYVVEQYPDSRITITPAPDTTLPPSYLSEVTFAFDGELTVVEENPNVKISKETGSKPEQSDYTGEITLNDSSFSIDLSYLPEGTYTVIIPSGYVLIDDNQVNGEIWVKYTVFNGLPSAVMLQGPGAINASGYLTSLMLTWDYQPISATDLGLSATISGFDASFNDVNIDIPSDAFNFVWIDQPTGEPGGPSTSTRAGEGKNVLMIDYAQYLGDITGSFTISIPQGIVANADNAVNPSEEITFSIYNYAPTLATITSEGNTITVKWDGYGVSSIAEDAPWFIEDKGKRINLSEKNQWTTGGQIETDYGQGIYTVDLSDLNLENGSYTLYIPEYSVLLTGENYVTYLAHEQYYDFEMINGDVSAVKALQEESIDPKVAGVYTLHGVKVAEDASNLPAGLYIINGKKVIICK